MGEYSWLTHPTSCERVSSWILTACQPHMVISGQSCKRRKRSEICVKKLFWSSQQQSLFLSVQAATICWQTHQGLWPVLGSLPLTPTTSCVSPQSSPHLTSLCASISISSAWKVKTVAKTASLWVDPVEWDAAIIFLPKLTRLTHSQVHDATAFKWRVTILSC